MYGCGYKLLTSFCGNWLPCVGRRVSEEVGQGVRDTTILSKVLQHTEVKQTQTYWPGSALLNLRLNVFIIVLLKYDTRIIKTPKIHGLAATSSG